LGTPLAPCQRRMERRHGRPGRCCKYSERGGIKGRRPRQRPAGARPMACLFWRGRNHWPTTGAHPRQCHGNNLGVRGLRLTSGDASGSAAPAKSDICEKNSEGTALRFASWPLLPPEDRRQLVVWDVEVTRGESSFPPATRSCGGMENPSPSGRCPRRARLLRRESAMRSFHLASGNGSLETRKATNQCGGALRSSAQAVTCLRAIGRQCIPCRDPSDLTHRS